MTKIYSIIKTILEVFSIGKMLLEYWEEYKLRKVERQVEERNSARGTLNSKIEKEAAKDKPDEEVIKDLHRRLNNISGRM